MSWRKRSSRQARWWGGISPIRFTYDLASHTLQTQRCGSIWATSMARVRLIRVGIGEVGPERRKQAEICPFGRCLGQRLVRLSCRCIEPRQVPGRWRVTQGVQPSCPANLTSVRIIRPGLGRTLHHAVSGQFPISPLFVLLQAPLPTAMLNDTAYHKEEGGSESLHYAVENAVQKDLHNRMPSCQRGSCANRRRIEIENFEPSLLRTCRIRSNSGRCSS